MHMKKMILVTIAAVYLVFSNTPAYAAESEAQVLVDMLIENGVLTKEQGKVFAVKAKELAAQRASESAAGRRAAYMSKDMKNYEVTTTWKDKLTFETADGNFKARIGGRIHTDLVYIKGQGALTDLVTGGVRGFDMRNDRALIRRARILLQGTVYEDFFYKLQYDFADNLNGFNEIDGFRDVYIGMQDIPYIGKVTLGQMKEPFSLEELISSNNITFAERSLPNVFAPGRSWGIKMNNTLCDKRITYALGAYRNSTASGSMANGNEWNLTTRVTALPWYEGDDKLLHIGGAYSFRRPESWNMDQVRFRERPELRTVARFADTGNFAIEEENLVGLEGAVVYGPLSLQGEFIGTWLKNPTGQKKQGFLYGAYGYVSYFLTGEHKNYKKSSGEFGGVTPLNNFSLKDGTWGAWELAARYSYLDLKDDRVSVLGGLLNDATVGVNWYLNPIMRIMFNYVHSNRNGVGYADGVQVRAQVVF